MARFIRIGIATTALTATYLVDPVVGWSLLGATLAFSVGRRRLRSLAATCLT